MILPLPEGEGRGEGEGGVSRIHAVELGSAPASGAVGRALAAHSGRMEFTHCLVRPRASVFGAGARRTAAEAAALPTNSTAWIRLRNGELIYIALIALVGFQFGDE